MLKIAIVDTNYTKRKYRGMAALWLEWELSKRGIVESDPRVADVLLCTVSSQQGVAKLRGALKRIKNKRAKIVVGGGGAYAPAIFDPVVGAVCVGEGARFIETLVSDGYSAAVSLPETWIPYDTCQVVPSTGFPWGIPPLNHPDGTVRVFGSRGCKYKCLFCQTGWETSYRVHPQPAELQRQITGLERAQKRIAIVTNDGAEEGVKISGTQEFLSVRLDNLEKLKPLSRQKVRSVRIGVEGISERLRAAVGKPVKNDDLLTHTFYLLSVGIGVRWFFIPGLPGETDKDYSDLRYLVKNLRRLPKGCVMMNFHSFIPQPATPLSVLPLADDYWERFDEFRRWFFHGPGFTRHVQIVAPSQYKGRMRRAQESMAATETELRRGWMEKDNPNWRVKYIAPPNRLRAIAMRYAEKVGL